MVDMVEIGGIQYRRETAERLGLLGDGPAGEQPINPFVIPGVTKARTPGSVAVATGLPPAGDEPSPAGDQPAGEKDDTTPPPVTSTGPVTRPPRRGSRS
jgi:hypothetical protein